MNAQLDYKDKVCVVTGGSSGVGKAAVEGLLQLGAKVYVLDFKPTEDEVEKYIPINLNDRASIDAAIAELPDGIDCIFHTAGVPGPTVDEAHKYNGQGISVMDVVRINYIGARYYFENVLPKMNEGGAICAVASIASMQWRYHIDRYAEFIAINDWDEAVAYAETKVDDPEWIKETGHNTQTYVFTKECLNMYVCHKAWEVASKQIRMNTTCPGPILTPMHGFFRVASGHDFDSAMPTSPCGRESLPEEQAGAMLLLNSNLASYISGVALDVDFGLAYNIVYYGGTGAPGDH